MDKEEEEGGGVTDDNVVTEEEEEGEGIIITSVTSIATTSSSTATGAEEEGSSCSSLVVATGTGVSGSDEGGGGDAGKDVVSGGRGTDGTTTGETSSSGGQEDSVETTTESSISASTAAAAVTTMPSASAFQASEIPMEVDSEGATTTPQGQGQVDQEDSSKGKPGNIQGTHEEEGGGTTTTEQIGDNDGPPPLLPIESGGGSQLPSGKVGVGIGGPPSTSTTKSPLRVSHARQQGQPKRRPGRPIGSTGPYKRRTVAPTSADRYLLDYSKPSADGGVGGSYGSTRVSSGNREVRVSSRMSTSIFKHDITGGSAALASSQQENSPFVYFPTAAKKPYTLSQASPPLAPLSGGKPPMSGLRKPYTKRIYKKRYNKDKNKEADKDQASASVAAGGDGEPPVVTKRKYTKRKKVAEGMGMKDPSSSFPYHHPIHGLEDYSDSDFEAAEKSTKFHLSDNGVWRPTDDLRLIINVEATNDLESVYQGVKFSCYFSSKEIEDRWRMLLYNEKAGLVAQNAINNLHPDVKSKIYHDSLFNKEESKLVASIKALPDSNPPMKSFQTLLDENPHVFNRYRSARSLLSQWLTMKDFHLLENQNVMDYQPGQNFEELESVVCNEDADSDEEVEGESVWTELKTEERSLKKKLRLLDEELNAWQTITGQLIEDGMKNSLPLPPAPTDFDGKTYALLRGKEVYYGMTSREIVLGRSTKECKVDADLSEEGASNKISRKQAVIRLKRMGHFVIINKGRRPIFVDKKVVPYRCAAALHDQSVIQIAHITLIFLINESLVSRIIERDVSAEIYASFKDLESEGLSPKKDPSFSSVPGSTPSSSHLQQHASSSSHMNIMQSVTAAASEFYQQQQQHFAMAAAANSTMIIGDRIATTDAIISAKNNVDVSSSTSLV